MIQTVIFAAAASTAFSVIFNVRGKNLLLAALCSALGFYTYLSFLGESEFKAMVLASIVIAFSAELIARISRSPATLFLVAGLLPLVPGGDMFQMFVKLLESDNREALDFFLRAIKSSGALAAGVIIVTALIRFVPPFHRRKRRSRKHGLTEETIPDENLDRL